MFQQTPRVDLFKEQLRESLRHETLHSRTARIARHADVYTSGHQDDMVYFIERGQIKLRMLSPEGKECLLAIHSAGDLFGELCLSGSGYENKDIVDANKRLKDELNKLYSEQTHALKDVLVRLPIIDCADAFWPFLRIWKRRLREYSEKEGIAIYCDWQGKMASDYKMKADVSNVVIIDKSGRIRLFTSGDVTAE